MRLVEAVHADLVRDVADTERALRVARADIATRVVGAALLVQSTLRVREALEARAVRTLVRIALRCLHRAVAIAFATDRARLIDAQLAKRAVGAVEAVDADLGVEIAAPVAYPLAFKRVARVRRSLPRRYPRLSRTPCW